MKPMEFVWLVGAVAVGVVVAGGVFRFAQKQDIAFIKEASEGFQGI